MQHQEGYRRQAVSLGTSMFFFMGYLLVGCGEPPVPCDPCPSIGGTFEVETATTRGACDFSPLNLYGIFQLEQSADTTRLETTVNDTVTGEYIRLTGDVHHPHPRDPEGTLAGFIIDNQVIRPAKQDDPRLVTLQVAMSGSVSQGGAGKKVHGTLLSIDVTPGTTTRCEMGAVFSAIEVTDAQ